jgi:O-antigen ligase
VLGRLHAAVLDCITARFCDSPDSNPILIRSVGLSCTFLPSEKMAYLGKKELLNISILVISLTLMLLIFEFTETESQLYVLAAVGFFAFLFFLFNRVLLISFFIALSFFDFTIEGLTYFKALGYLLLVVLSINLFLKEIHIDFSNRLVLLFIAIFMTCSAGQLINRTFVPFYLSKLLMIFCMMIAISVFIKRLDELKFVLLVLAVAGLVAAGITIYEVIIDPNLKRATGSLGNPNNTAAIFCMLLPFSTVVLSRKNKLWTYMFALAAMIIMLIAIFLTASRGALLSLSAIAIGALVMFNLKGKIITISLMLLTFIVFYNVFDSYQGLKRYEQIVNSGSVMESQAVKVRMEITAIGLQIFMENPIWGIGAGNFQTETKDMDTEYNGYLYGGIAPHNMYTQILAELGIIGFILFGWFYFSIFENILDGIRNRNPEISRIAKILLFAFIAIMVSMVTSGNYVKPFIYILAGFSIVIKKLSLSKKELFKKPRYIDVHAGAENPELRQDRYPVPLEDSRINDWTLN